MSLAQAACTPHRSRVTYCGAVGRTCLPVIKLPRAFHACRPRLGSTLRCAAAPFHCCTGACRSAPPLRKMGEGRQGTANSRSMQRRLGALAGRAKACMSPADSSVREESILLGRGYPVAARLCSRPCANTAGGTIEKPPQGPCQGCVPRPGHPDGEARVPCRGHARSPIAASRSATLRRCPARASGIATLCYRLLAIDVLIVTSGTWHDLLLKSQQQIIGRR